MRRSLRSTFRFELPHSPWVSKRGPPLPKHVLYRAPGMLLWRVVVRAKVFQLMGFLATAMLATSLMAATNPNPAEAAAVAALSVGCVVTSYCIWYYSGRYVGELSLLLPERRAVRISVLDFWGNRQDHDVPLERLVPPFKGLSMAEVKRLAGHALMPLRVAGDKDYFVSVRHGRISDKETLQSIFFGTYSPPAVEDRTAAGQQAAAAAAAAAGAGAAGQQAAAAACSAEEERNGAAPAAGGHAGTGMHATAAAAAAAGEQHQLSAPLGDSQPPGGEASCSAQVAQGSSLPREQRHVDAISSTGSGDSTTAAKAPLA